MFIKCPDGSDVCMWDLTVLNFRTGIIINYLMLVAVVAYWFDLYTRIHHACVP